MANQLISRELMEEICLTLLPMSYLILKYIDNLTLLLQCVCSQWQPYLSVLWSCSTTVGWLSTLAFMCVVCFHLQHFVCCFGGTFTFFTAVVYYHFSCTCTSLIRKLHLQEEPECWYT